MNTLTKISGLLPAFKRLCYVAVLICTVSALPAVEDPFVASFATHSDGSTWMQFPGYAGMHFTVERSTDLVTFETMSGGLFYGDGNPKEFFIMDPPPPPTSSGSPPPGVKPKIILSGIGILVSNVTGNYRTLVRKFTGGPNDWVAELPFTVPKSASTLAALSLESSAKRY